MRVRHWVTFHGIALNVDCDLSHFQGHRPLRHFADANLGVTSLLDLGIIAPMPEVDAALMASFAEVFAAPKLACA